MNCEKVRLAAKFEGTMTLLDVGTVEKSKNKVRLVLISLMVLFLTNSVIAGQGTQFQLEQTRATSGLDRLAAHWSLNVADYDGNYLDAVEGYIAQPTGEPNFIDGVRDEPNGAVMITPSTGWGLSEAFGADLTNGFTICLWVNWNGDWQEPVSISDLVVESRGSEYVVTNAIKDDQRWQHVCITYDNSMVRVYLNGRLRLSKMWELPAGCEAAIEIGNTLGQQIFNGAIDDIRLYDYALSQTEISQLVTGDANCTLPYASEYDFSGPYGLPDCVVNFYDLVEFSKHWLENCIPECSSEFDFSGPYGVPDCVVDMYDLAEFCNHWLSCGRFLSCP